MKIFLFIVCTVGMAVSCNSDKNEVVLPTGYWRAVIEIQNEELPFNFELIKSNAGRYQAYLINADERIELDDIRINKDSVDIPLHIFDANIKAVFDADSMKGFFIKNYETDYIIPFRAAHGQQFRFKKDTNVDTVRSFTGKYAVTFYDKQDTTEAVAIFEQSGDSVTGTFLTPTGDYRFLQGNVVDQRLQLSTFDGNHAYLFYAKHEENGKLTGEYYSGKTYYATWTATPDENAKLPDAESLTYLKKGFEKISFSFPDTTGKKISLDDEKYRGKVVVLQLMGSWCPNCMDETKFLAPWHQKNKDRGVEIIGLAYERKDDFDYASDRVKKMIKKLNIEYDVVIAGTNDKTKAAETLPMLNTVVAFPTTIFIGKDGKVKKIHTGFSGPGTGIYYQQFTEDFNQTINELLTENFASE